MEAFQPDAPTISRGKIWADRRRFAEAVLNTGKPLHRLAQAFVGVAAGAADQVASQPIRWQSFNKVSQRMTRRIVLGEKAAGDTHITDLLSELIRRATRSG